MSSYPQCAGCARTASDWIPVGDARWEPDLMQVQPDRWLCWKCREEPHPDMREGLVDFDTDPQMA